MSWDNARPVPWRRLAREWVLYAGIMVVVFLLFFRNDSMVGAFVGVLASGPLYLGLGYVMAKFGYQRTTLTQRRAQSTSAGASSPAASGSSEPGNANRPKPAATKRTGASSNRPTSSSKRTR